MAFMVAAYLVIWLAAFAFIVGMVRRQSTLQREISSLRELARERDARDSREPRGQ
jgi:CcmD family protein